MTMFFLISLLFATSPAQHLTVAEARATAVSQEVPVAAPAGRGGRLGPPAAVTCDRNKLTVYSGRITKYSRKRGRTTITIATDWDTTETVILRHAGDDPSRDYLVLGTPFTPSDWNRIESKKGVLHPGMRANAWVCTGGRTIVDWAPAGGRMAEGGGQKD